MFRNIGNIMHTHSGKMVISIILGIGLASLFRKSCSEKKCYDFIAPDTEEIKDTIYQHDKSCYNFITETRPCKNTKPVLFA